MTQTSKKSIKDLADFIVSYMNVEGLDITHLKLQKLLYYLQAWHLVFFDNDPLFNEEPEAWVNGPVYKSIYYEYKEFKNNPIEINIDADGLKTKLENLNLTSDQKDLLFEVLKIYSSMSAEKLVYITHIEDPWNKAREGFGPFELCTNSITYRSMHDYYKKRIEKDNN